MNYYPGPGGQPALVSAQEKPGYYAAGPAFQQTFPAAGIQASAGPQTGATMAQVGQHPAAAYGQPTAAAYGMPSPYSGTTSYPALSSAAYGASLQSSLGSSAAAFQGLGHPSVVPTSLGHISPTTSLAYQQASYSQPTYLATPIMTSPEQQAYQQQMNQMYQSASPYPGYPGVQMQPGHPSYPTLAYSQGLSSTRGINPSYPGGMGFVPRYTYK